jgi:integrase
MASVQRQRQGAAWRAMWRDADGRQRSKSFARKGDAQRFLAKVTSSIDEGSYVDPLNRTTFAEYVARWEPAQPWRPSTREQVASHLRAHLLPAFGHRPMRTIQRTDVQSLVARLDAAGLAPATIEAIYRRLVSIFEAAVLDRVIAQSPAVRIALPRRTRQAADAVVVLDLDAIERLADAVPARLEAFVWVMAAAGLRPGEAAGLTSSASSSCATSSSSTASS